MTEDNVIYTNEGAADLLTCSANTLRNSRSTGKLFGREAPPFIKLGRKVAYRRKDLLDWIAGFPTYSNTAEERFYEPHTTKEQTESREVSA